MISLKGTFRVVKVLGKTRAAGWDVIAEGDIIELDSQVKGAGQRRHGCYAQEIRMYCPEKSVEAISSFNQTANTIYKFFELEEV